MKKLLVLIAIVGLLTACGGSNELQGKYVRADDESKICDEYMDFKDKQTFEAQTTKKVSGYISSGTYEEVGENEYKFNYDGGGSDIYTLEFSDDDKTLKATQSGHDACTFTREEE